MKIPTEDFYKMARPVLKSGRAVSFKIKGNSMYPFLKDGEIVRLIRKETYRRGDIVFTRDMFSNTIVLHYITEKLGKFYMLMGAANLVQEEFCRLDDIAGAVEVPHIHRFGVLIWDTLWLFRRHLLWLCRKFDI